MIEKMNVLSVGWMERLRRGMTVALIFLSVSTVAAQELESQWLSTAYVGAAGTLAFRQGGERVGGGDVRLGVELSDAFSPELDAGWHENSAFLALQDLVHLSAFEMYDRFFGYSRFDPFFTFGGGGWIGGFEQFGPMAGIGAFWHLDDNWSIRAEASTILGLDGECEMIYLMSVGLQYSFGGQGE